MERPLSALPAELSAPMRSADTPRDEFSPNPQNQQIPTANSDSTKNKTKKDKNINLNPTNSADAAQPLPAAATTPVDQQLLSPHSISSLQPTTSLTLPDIIQSSLANQHSQNSGISRDGESLTNDAHASCCPNPSAQPVDAHIGVEVLTNTVTLSLSDRRTLDVDQDTRRKIKLNEVAQGTPVKSALKQNSPRPHPETVPTPSSSPPPSTSAQQQAQDRRANYVKVLVVSRQEQTSHSPGEWMVALARVGHRGRDHSLGWPVIRVVASDNGDSVAAAQRGLHAETGLAIEREEMDFLGFETSSLLGQEVVTAAFMVVLEDRPSILSWDPSFIDLPASELALKQRRGAWVTVSKLNGQLLSKHKILSSQEPGVLFNAVLAVIGKHHRSRTQRKSRISKRPHFCYSAEDLVSWRFAMRTGRKSPLSSPTVKTPNPRQKPAVKRPVESSEERRERRRSEAEARRCSRADARRRRERAREIRGAESMSFPEAVMQLKHYVAERVTIHP